MSLSFLVIANVVLLTRLVVLFKDEPARGRAWAVKCAIELGALPVCYVVSGPVGSAAAVVVLFNLLGARWERRLRPKDFGRLVLGLLELAALSVCFAPAFGAEFRPIWSRIGTALPEWTTLAALGRGLGRRDVQAFAFGLLLSANEANLAIRAFFNWLDLKPRLPAPGNQTVDVGEFNRGRIIGVLERGLLYVFILQSQFGAIGFVLAAKAFTRFKALDDRPFAEYVLIGTLLSAGLALTIGTLVRGLF